MYKIFSPPSSNSKKGYSDINPYGSVDPTMQLSPWNRFTDWLGITNNTGKANYQNQLMAEQWETSRNLALEDREYNSYSNQAQEMRSAGLNPDFANPSAGMSDLAGQQPNNTAQPFTEEMAFGQFLSTAFNTAISVASGLANIQNLGFSQDLAILDSSVDSAKSGFIGHFASSLFDRYSSGLDDELIKYINSSKFSSEVDDFLFQSDEYKKFHNNFKTKRGKKIFDRFLDDYLHSDEVRNDILESIKKTTDNTLTTSAKVAEFDVMRSKDPNNQLTEVSKILAKYQYKTLENDLKRAEEKSADDLKFQEAFDGGLAADAVNAANKEGFESSQAETNFRSMERGIIKDLKDAADNGNQIATALLGAIVIASKFTASSSSGTHVNQSTGEIFQDRGLTFGF